MEEEKDQKTQGVSPGKKKKRLFFFWGVLILGLLGGNLLYSNVYMHSRHDRSYCVECHQFSSIDAMWEVSDIHSEGITCIQCHGMIPGVPGRRGAFSAHHEVVNPNCIGCHPSVVQGKQIEKTVQVRLPPSKNPDKETETFEWPLQSLMYEWHVKKKICLCTDCHRNIAHSKGVETPGARYRPAMAYCKECHYHAAKDSYVKVSPLPALEIKEIQKP